MKRERNDIYRDILKVLLYEGETGFTRLMSKVNTTHSYLSKVFLPFLLEKGFIKRCKMRPSYSITIKGIDYYINIEVSRRLLNVYS